MSDHNQPRTIALHIGAHKTATTHFQRSVLDKRPAVTRHGVQFYGPAQLRKPGQSLADRFGLDVFERPVAPDADPEAALADLIKRGHRLVLSEENFVGTLQNRWGNIEMPLYPRAPERIAALAETIAPQGLEIFIGIRNATRFMTSAYGQVLLGGQIVPVEAFRRANPIPGIDWAELVSRLRATPGVARVTVWRYEDYTALFPTITAAMLGRVAAAEVQPLPKRVHSGLSFAAVEATYNWHNAGERGPIAALARTTYPIGPDAPRFDAFTLDEHSASDAQYVAQWAAIQEMDGVTALAP